MNEQQEVRMKIQVWIHEKYDFIPGHPIPTVVFESTKH